MAVAVTRPAASPPRARFNVRVGVVERMAVDAVGGAEVASSRAMSAPRVFAHRYNSQVVRIHARAHSALVVNDEALGNGANMRFP